MKTNKERILYFDGLRGVMAIIVAYGHFFGQTKLFMLDKYPTNVPNSLLNFYQLTETTPFIFSINGNFATTVFFILSGCVLINAFKANSSFIGAFIRRFIRLGLPVFISCLLGYVMLKFQLRDDYNGESTFDDVIKQGIQTLYSADLYTRFLNPVIWSMSTEFVGSILLLLVSCISRFSMRNALGCLFVITILTYGYYIFFMCIGAWLTIIFKDTKTETAASKGNIIITIILFAIVIFLQSCPVFHPWGGVYIPDQMLIKPLIDLNNFSIIGMYPYKNYEFLRGLGGILLLYLVLTRINFQRILNTPLAQFLGKISFSLYLIHWLILSSITLPINYYIFKSSGSVYFSILGSFIIYASVSITFSLIFFHFIESRAISYSRNIGIKIDKFIDKQVESNK
ncbi:acyltransferase family protein [Pantoea stewartii]|uniref:acyltransferase family protein n=1 Tax=Pantoea stewartii TaxID=66269 RepID=UPI001981C17B